jgi:hypothetical protein
MDHTLTKDLWLALNKQESMTKDQELHLGRVLEMFELKADEKYRNGQKEHGGNMWEMGMVELIENAMDEAIDQWVYLYTIYEQLIGTKSERK